MIYLDYNATTPVDKRVIEAMLPYFDEVYANPSSDHIAGIDSKKSVDQSREQVAKLICAREDEIIFTSGASEANNLALLGLAEVNKRKKNHIITSQIEHPAILSPCKYLENKGYEVTYVSVDKKGRVNSDEIKKAITENTFLVSIMFANNETGTIQPIERIGAITRENNVFFHVDAAQAAGHVPIDVDALNIDLMSISGHKYYGPKGTGVLFMRNRVPRVRPTPIILGGGQERGFRSGTLNVPGIVGLGKACEIAKKEMKKNHKKFKGFTTKIYDSLKEVRSDIQLNGDSEHKLAHTLNLNIPGVDNKWLSFKMKEFCFSTGSACSNDKDEPSHVLLAMGLNEKCIKNCIRVGVGFNTSDVDVDAFIDTLGKLVN
jgi:cysteine desulfurase